MNYSVTSIRIPSRWFDVPDRKENTFQKMGGYKGFYLYLQLYKFRLHNQENEHTFITSVSLLRKETGYTTEEIFKLLKKLVGAKILNSIPGVSRWEYLVDDNGQIKEDKTLFITVNQDESFPIMGKYDKTEDFYIYISFRLLEGYKSKGLDEKHFALHCLVQRFQRGGVCYMAIETMADTLDIDKDTINRMIFNMNRHYYLVSWRKSNSQKRGEGSYRYEHITFEDSNRYEEPDKNVSHWDGWLFRYKSDMDVMAKRADRRAERKSKQREKKKVVIMKSKNKENDLLVQEHVRINEPKHGFGIKKAQVVIGEPDPFANVSDENIAQYEDDYSWMADLD